MFTITRRLNRSPLPPAMVLLRLSDADSCRDTRSPRGPPWHSLSPCTSSSAHPPPPAPPSPPLIPCTPSGCSARTASPCPGPTAGAASFGRQRPRHPLGGLTPIPVSVSVSVDREALPGPNGGSPPAGPTFVVAHVVRPTRGLLHTHRPRHRLGLLELVCLRLCAIVLVLRPAPCGRLPRNVRRGLPVVAGPARSPAG